MMQFYFSSKPCQNQKYGFSLVELSIVLVILGLLTGGILAGQNLIKAAELRKVATDYGTYSTAINTFKNKYFALPGDMTNAVRFWGASSGGTGDGANSTCMADSLDPANAAVGTETCNGDGDGFVAGSFAFGAGCTTDYSDLGERYRFWQHLTNAGLIAGKHNGVGNGTMYVSGESVPRAPLNGSWVMAGFNPSASCTWITPMLVFDAEKTNYLYYVRNSGEFSWSWTVPIISPEDAYNIDTKMDDGLPKTGKILGGGMDSSIGFCANTGNSYFNSTSASGGEVMQVKSCGLAFKI